MSKKRYRIYLHQFLSDTVEVVADNIQQARDAVREALMCNQLYPHFDEVEETDVDEMQLDEGTDEHLEYADYEVNEDGELVEVNQE